MKVLVLGASLNPRRYSHHAVNLLVEKGHEVIGIGSTEGSLGTVNISSELKEEQDIHTVTLYINPDIQEEYYDKIIALKPQRVIFNPGSENPELVDLLRKNKIAYSFSCTLVMLRTESF